MSQSYFTQLTLVRKNAKMGSGLVTVQLVSGQLRTIRIAPKKAMTCQTETLADLEGRGQASWLEHCSSGTGRTGGQWNRSVIWTQLD